MRYVVPLKIASLSSKENVNPSAVTTTNDAPPGTIVVLGRPIPSEPIETFVPCTEIVVAGALSPIRYVVPEIMATVGPTVIVRSPIAVVNVVVAGETVDASCC